LGAAATTVAEPTAVAAVAVTVTVARGGTLLLTLFGTAAFGIGAAGRAPTLPKSLPKSLPPLSKYDKADGAATGAAAVDEVGSDDTDDDTAAAAVCCRGCGGADAGICSCGADCTGLETAGEATATGMER
jgi:hypothetical protein